MQPVLHRVMARRMDFVVALFERLGFARDEAVHRGTLACTAYVGHSELSARLPHLLPAESEARAGYLDAVLDLLVRGRPSAPSTSTRISSPSTAPAASTSPSPLQKLPGS